jgi:hypothetical protein
LWCKLVSCARVRRNDHGPRLGDLTRLGLIRISLRMDCCVHYLLRLFLRLTSYVLLLRWWRRRWDAVSISRDILRCPVLWRAVVIVHWSGCRRRRRVGLLFVLEFRIDFCSGSKYVTHLARLRFWCWLNIGRRAYWAKSGKRRFWRRLRGDCS